MALHNYHDQNNKFPPGAVLPNTSNRMLSIWGRNHRT